MARGVVYALASFSSSLLRSCLQSTACHVVLSPHEVHILGGEMLGIDLHVW